MVGVGPRGQVEAAGGMRGIAAVARPCCRPADDSDRPRPGLGCGDRRRRPAAPGPTAGRSARRPATAGSAAGRAMTRAGRGPASAMSAPAGGTGPCLPFGLGFCECDFCQQTRLRSGIRLMLSPLTLPRRQPPLPIKASCPFRVF